MTLETSESTMAVAFIDLGTWCHIRAFQNRSKKTPHDKGFQNILSINFLLLFYKNFGGTMVYSQSQI